jgi:hypothetical protein
MDKGVGRLEILPIILTGYLFFCLVKILRMQKAHRRFLLLRNKQYEHLLEMPVRELKNPEIAQLFAEVLDGRPIKMYKRNLVIMGTVILATCGLLLSAV